MAQHSLRVMSFVPTVDIDRSEIKCAPEKTETLLSPNRHVSVPSSTAKVLYQVGKTIYVGEIPKLSMPITCFIDSEQSARPRCRG
jgi:hypothetical protein